MAVVIYWVLSPAEVWAWGPATHVRLAHEVLSTLSLLPAGVGGLLSRYAVDYIFGNIAADVVFAKKRSRIKQVCHQWRTGFELLREAPTDKTRAFAYGYLSHLAADTVAHNKFIPRQITVSTTMTTNFAHLYWELRADQAIEEKYWSELRRLVGRRFADHESHIATKLTETLLPFSWNIRLFHRINDVSTRRSLRTTIIIADRFSKVDLNPRLLGDYHDESIDRIHSVLEHGEDSAVLNEDPNGNAALYQTRHDRRRYRHLVRAGYPKSAILHELVLGHEPAPQPRPSCPPL
jgi:hypothetical protein